MTPIILVDKLIEFIKPVVADFRLETNVKGLSPRAPQVQGGYLKEKLPNQIQAQAEPDFPNVIVRFVEMTDREDGSVATVKIMAGTHSHDEKDGWRDCMNVITRIKTALIKKGTIGPFRFNTPYLLELPEEQMHPYWVAVLTLNVEVPQPQIEEVL